MISNLFSRPVAHAAMVAATIFAVGLTWTNQAEAQLKVDITRGNVEPLPIAIPFFSNAGAAATGEIEK